MMTPAEFLAKAQQCLTFDALVHLLCAEWGCVHGTFAELNALRQQVSDRLAELDHRSHPALAAQAA